MNSEELINKLPKVELHCHLDGSVPFQTLEYLATQDNYDLELLSEIRVKGKCTDLNDYLKSFEIILPLLQSYKNLVLATYNTIKNISEENIVYLELRFAPLLHTKKGMNVQEVVAAVVEGVNRAVSQFDIYVNLLICIMRHDSIESGQDLINSISEIDNDVIVGFDFAGNEMPNANEGIGELTDEILKKNFKLTLHSGECNCPNNVYQAIQLGAKRIGHGVAIRNDKNIMAYCEENKVLLELAPTSNYQTNAVETLESYPLRLFLENNIICNINTDNRTVSDITLTKEYLLMMKHCELSLEEMREMNLNAIKYSFSSHEIKKEIEEKIQSDFEKYLI